MSSGTKIETFAVLDLETTGLPGPGQEVDITEISIHAFSAQSVRNKVAPRITHKLALAFTPKVPIDPVAARISALNMSILDGESYFDTNAGTAITSFLNHLKKPVCLVAHNGNQFDFPILKSAFKKIPMEFPEGFKCIDSLEVFKRLNAGNNERYSLAAVYFRWFGKTPVGAHEADNDVVTLKQIMLEIGEPFVQDSEMRARPFI